MKHAVTEDPTPACRQEPVSFDMLVDVLVPPAPEPPVRLLRLTAELPYDTAESYYRRLDGQWRELRSTVPGERVPVGFARFLGQHIGNKMAFTPFPVPGMHVGVGPVSAVWTSVGILTSASSLGDTVRRAPGTAAVASARRALGAIGLAPSIVIHAGTALWGLWLLEQASED